jgi:hypothetical protein
LWQRRGSLLEAFYLGRETLLEISGWSMPAGVKNHVEKNWEDSKFGMPEEIGGGQKKEKGKEEKKEKIKEDKKKGKNEEVDDDVEEDKQFEMEDERIWTEMNLNKGEKSELPGAYMWAMAKYAYIEVLFKQGRYDEVIAQINAVKLELEELNDTYFMRLYYEFLTMIKVNQGDLEGSKSMFDGLKAYAERLGHDDIKLAQFYGNMAEFFYLSYPEKAIEIFKESRVIFWINMKHRGLKVIDIYEHIDLEKGSIKENKIPDSQEDKEKPKPPVEEKKDPKQKGKADPKAEASVEKDYSNIERIITFSKEMNYEFFMIDDKEGLKLNKKNDTYILNLDGLVKVNLRYSQALCTLDTKYDLAIIVLKETLRLLDRCELLNPYHRYMTHFLYGYCSKMLFLTKLKEFQKQYGSSTVTKGRSKYQEFIESVPIAGIAPSHLFYLLPNYSNNIRNGWKELLITAKEQLEKAVKVAKEE